MQPKVIYQKIENGHVADMKEQSFIAHSLLTKLTGKTVKHSETGRPILDQSVDVSVSHKEGLICAGIVPKPYKLGIDIERIDADINAELFFGSVITKKESSFLKTFCSNNDLSLTSGVAIFWSIKESFFKCLDYDFKPGKINILNIFKNNKVEIGYSVEISRLMKKRKLKLCSIKTILGKKYIYSQSIMKGACF